MPLNENYKFVSMKSNYKVNDFKCFNGNKWEEKLLSVLVGACLFAILCLMTLFGKTTQTNLNLKLSVGRIKLH